MVDMEVSHSCLTLKIFIGSMIERRRDYEKKEPSKDAHKIYIVCEGALSEPKYFNFFKDLSSNLEVIVIPPIKGTDPLKLKEHAQSAFIGDDRKYTLDYCQGDTVWFVIDTDSWEDENKIQPLRDFCAQQNDIIHREYGEIRRYSIWNVAQSNPCFEIWLYYHLYEQKPLDVDVCKCDSFKDFVGQSYSGGFDFEKDTARICDAIANSKANYSVDDNGRLTNYCTEMHILGVEIHKFVQRDVKRLRDRLA